MGQNNRSIGSYGEKLAAEYIKDKGYTILDVNFRLDFGEIDMIAAYGGTVVFIEVKYRKSLRYGYPREAVGKRKQNTLRKAALCYMDRHMLNRRDCRFDVIEIVDDGKLAIEHIENAF